MHWSVVTPYYALTHHICIHWRTHQWCNLVAWFFDALVENCIMQYWCIHFWDALAFGRIIFYVINVHIHDVSWRCIFWTQYIEMHNAILTQTFLDALTFGRIILYDIDVHIYDAIWLRIILDAIYGYMVSLRLQLRMTQLRSMQLRRMQLRTRTQWRRTPTMYTTASLPIEL